MAGSVLGKRRGGSSAMLVRVPNPMPGGRNLRFANKDQDRDLDGWLTSETFGP